MNTTIKKVIINMKSPTTIKMNIVVAEDLKIDNNKKSRYV